MGGDGQTGGTADTTMVGIGCCRLGARWCARQVRRSAASSPQAHRGRSLIETFMDTPPDFFTEDGELGPPVGVDQHFPSKDCGRALFGWPFGQLFGPAALGEYWAAAGPTRGHSCGWRADGMWQDPPGGKFAAQTSQK
eukprot:gene24649-biopygen20908